MDGMELTSIHEPETRTKWTEPNEYHRSEWEKSSLELDLNACDTLISFKHAHNTFPIRSALVSFSFLWFFTQFALIPGFSLFF